MRAALLAAGIYLLSCFIGGTIGNLYLIVGDHLSRGKPLPSDWVIGVFGFIIVSFPYALIGLAPVAVAAITFRSFASPSVLVLVASMIVLGALIGDWMTSDNFWKNYRYLHFGALAGAVTAGLWTWLMFRGRLRSGVRA